MDVLVTSSRMPYAIEEIRKLGRAGHRAYASDTFRAAPGSHSRYAADHFVTARPAERPEAFVDDVVTLLREHTIHRLMPSFEEVLHLARERERIEALTEPFFPSYDVLRRLHDKVAFIGLARELGLRTPHTLVARTRAELADATRELPRFFARQAFSRGGVQLFTNQGPLAGNVALEDCEPTEANPFVVQEFVEGEDVCTFSICHRGRVAGHSTYVHPLTVEHSGGIVFDSIVDDEGLEAVRRVVEATGYHGRVSFDFLRTREGLVVVECNPRPTAGLTILPDDMYDDAFMDRAPDRTLVAPAGTRRLLSLGVLRNMAVDWSEAPADLDALLSSGRDVYADPHDFLPVVWQVIAYGRVVGYKLRARRRKRSDLMQGYFWDICWNGEDAASRSRATR
ncbi:MAG: ATP-grasp domain-containing protein [Sandaracinaceae bacterium]